MSAPIVNVRRDGSITTIEKKVDQNSYRVAGVKITRELVGGVVELELNVDELIALVELVGTPRKRVRK